MHDNMSLKFALSASHSFIALGPILLTRINLNPGMDK